MDVKKIKARPREGGGGVGGREGGIGGLGREHEISWSCKLKSFKKRHIYYPGLTIPIRRGGRVDPCPHINNNCHNLLISE